MSKKKKNVNATSDETTIKKANTKNLMITCIFVWSIFLFTLGFIYWMYTLDVEHKQAKAEYISSGYIRFRERKQRY